MCRPAWMPVGLARPGSTTTTWAARTTSRWIASWATGSGRPCPTWRTASGPTAPSISAPYAQATQSIYPRSLAEVERFFAGLDLVAPQPGTDPAVSYVGVWGAEDPVAADSDGSRGLYCGVARRR